MERIETVIYGDVLVAVNFIINLMVLGLTRKLTGVPVKRYRRYLGALAGALCSFVIFLPTQGFLAELGIRLVVTALVIGVTYGGQSPKTLLRLSMVFFTVGFLMAGFVIGIWFLLPDDLLAFANGILYFNVTPLVLLGCTAAAYGFVSLFDHIFDGGNSRAGIWEVSVLRGGKTVRLQLFMDTGNHLVEPFSGLPVMVVSLRAVTGLLTRQERSYIVGECDIPPPGLRTVFYHGVGAQGLLPAFLPDQLLFMQNGSIQPAEGYLAVSDKELACGDCCGIFNPRLISAIASEQISGRCGTT